jgi:hypothetical protein
MAKSEERNRAAKMHAMEIVALAESTPLGLTSTSVRVRNSLVKYAKMVAAMDGRLVGPKQHH